MDNKSFTIRPEPNTFCFIAGIYVFFVLLILPSKGTLSTKLILLIGFGALIAFMFYRAYYKNTITVTETTLTLVTLPRAGIYHIKNSVATLEYSAIKEVGINKVLLVVTDLHGEQYVMKTSVFSKDRLLLLESTLKSHGVYVVTKL